MVCETAKVFSVSDWEVDPSTRRICRNDRAIQLEPKTMELLVFLCTHSGRVVSRDEIEAEIWKNRVVSYDAVTNAIVKLRKALDDDPKNPHIIETLSKKGYRIVAPVTFPHADSNKPTSQVPTNDFSYHKASQNRYRYSLIAASLLVFMLVIFGLSYWQLPESNYVINKKLPTIAVLPFVNQSGDPDQEYVADGVTDDLITKMAMSPELRVIARDSSFFYKDEPLNISRIGNQLDVQFVVHGSVHRAGDQLLINAKLTDVKSGNQLWAQHYSGVLVDIFSFEEAIITSVLANLAVNISIGAQQDLGTPQTHNPMAYDYFLHGRHLFYQYRSKVENHKARGLFQKAIEFDVDFAMAYAMLGWTHVFDVMNGWSTDEEQSLQLAINNAQKATSLLKGLPVAYFVSGLAYRQRGEYVKAMVEVEKAVQYDPNYANAHVLHATLLYYAGRPHHGLERIQKAMKLNPHHPYNYTFHLGQAFYVLGRYKDAIAAFRKGLESNPSSERLHVWLAAAYAQAGNAQEAEWETIAVLAANPGFSVDRMRNTFPFQDQEDREHFIDGLVKAGFPE